MTNQTDDIEAEIDHSRHALNDTIEALGGKLTPGQMLDEAMGLLQGQAGKWTANLGRQVRDNPLPLLLIAAGGALLFNSKHKAASGTLPAEDSDSDARFKALEAARSGLVRDAEEDDTTWANRLHEAEARALDVEQHAGEGIDSFKDRVKAAGEALGKAAFGVQHRVDAGYSHTSHAIADGASSARGYVTNQVHNAKLAAGGLKHRAQDFYAENPLAAGVIGVAVGALIGSAVPLSSIERDNLRGVADATARRGADLAGRGASIVKDVAEKAADAVH